MVSVTTRERRLNKASPLLLQLPSKLKGLKIGAELLNLMWSSTNTIKHLDLRKMLPNYFHLPFSKQLKGTIVSPLTVRSPQEAEVKWQRSEVMNISSEKINIH